MKWFHFTVFAFLSIPLSASALGPHELAILVNQNSPRSVALANHYAALRDIPGSNLIHLDLPDSLLNASARIQPADFRTYIYDPAQALIQERGLAGHILAWAYSLDFPVRVEWQQPFSVQGLTFTRGNMPTPDQVKNGTYTSLLFRGPDREGGTQSPALSLEQFAMAARTNMPLPSMMLGFAGSRGQTFEQALSTLTNSRRGDALSPPGWIYFIERKGDPRSDCRAWQFPGAQEELKSLGVAARITEDYPKQNSSVIGLMTGQAYLPPAALERAFLPGAYAEHLTSFGADFINPDQTKATAWLNHGAAGSAGTVIEPFANWAKFPHARLFAHYASGCTLLESLYQAIRCPLQILLIGDPLAAPWKRPPLLTLLSLNETDEGTPLSGQATFMASALGDSPVTYLFLMDGRPIAHPGNKSELRIDTRQLFDGYHELRAIAYIDGPVRQQASETLGFVCNNRDRQVKILDLEPGQVLELHQPLAVRLEITAKEPPVQIALISQERVLDRSGAQLGQAFTLNLDPLRLGEGPVQVQAVAVFSDKRAVRSPPLPLLIVNHTTPPPAPQVESSWNEELGKTVVTITTPGTNLKYQWQAALPLTEDKTFEQLVHPQTIRATAKHSEAGCTLSPATTQPGFYHGDIAFPKRLEQWEMTLTPSSGKNRPSRFGFVFQMTDDQTYSFVQFDAKSQAWSVGRVLDGETRTLASRGIPDFPDGPQTILLSQQSSTSLSVRIHATMEMSVPLTLDSGSWGWVTQGGDLHISEAWVSPPDCLRNGYRSDPETLFIPGEKDRTPDSLRLVAAKADDRAFTRLGPRASLSP
ncbi:MAG: TIGR03790 family protein [Kiritimatiellae bacterium]|nr:TIGR03790 family protein [Kiritimatiellia bacterium]